MQLIRKSQERKFLLCFDLIKIDALLFRECFHKFNNTSAQFGISAADDDNDDAATTAIAKNYIRNYWCRINRQQK